LCLLKVRGRPNIVNLNYHDELLTLRNSAPDFRAALTRDPVDRGHDVAVAQVEQSRIQLRFRRIYVGSARITETPLYPLRFEPIYQYRPWGGRRLAHLLTEPLPSGPIGEAWLLSDRDDHASQVAEGPLKGQTIGQLLKQFPEQMLGKLAHRFQRFRCC
jgi:hypothetical protein